MFVAFCLCFLHRCRLVTVCVTDLRTYIKVHKRYSIYDKNSVDTSENFMSEKDLRFIKILLLLYNRASHTVSSECSVDQGSE